MTQNVYAPRIIEAELKNLLEGHPAINIQGARGIGKTTTAAQMAGTIFDLEDPATIESVKTNPYQMVNASEPILIDEWQVYPQSWTMVRRAVDADSRPGRFILTGSVGPKTPPTHSGAGRITTIRMRPMSLAERWGNDLPPTVSLKSLLDGDDSPFTADTEVSVDDYLKEIVVGGLPGVRGQSSPSTLTAKKVEIAQRRMESYCQQVVDIEFSQAGHTLRNPAGLYRWLCAYAAATASATSFEKIRRAAVSDEGQMVAQTTTFPYRDTLAKMWATDPVGAWWHTSNALSRLTLRPKHHLADPAMAACLLRADVESLHAGKLPDAPVHVDVGMPGRLFESLMALNLRVYAQAADAEVFHFRSHRGEREIDFMIKKRHGGVLAVEVKFTNVPQEKDFRHLQWIKEQLGDQMVGAVLITAGRYAGRREDGIAVIPAALLGP